MNEELLTLALEALEWEEAQTAYPSRMMTNAITALREALAEQPAQQEPVAGLLVGQDSDGRYVSIAAKAYADTLPLGEYKLYTSPPAERKPLTDEQIDAAVKAWFENDIVVGRQPFAKRMRAAIEAAHGIKGNT